MNNHRFRTRLRIGLQICIMGVLSVLYTNCGSLKTSDVPSVTADSHSGSSDFTCDDATLQGVYQSGYYGFVRSHNCTLCHGTGGTGPAIGADDLGQAYNVFKVGTGVWVDQTLNANAVDPNHHGAGAATNQAAITAIAATWSSAVAANCKAIGAAPAIGLAYKYSLNAKPLTLAPGASATVTWNLATELAPANSLAVTGTTLQMTITASAADAVQSGYLMSKPLITSTSKGIKISGAKVVVNGTLYKLGSTFVNSVADIPAGVDSFPLSLGSIFVAMDKKAGDTFSLQIGDIAGPTIETNYPMPTYTGTVSFSDPTKFSELIQPGGPMVVNCLQCHNPVFKKGNLNVLDYFSVMQFVTPGLYSSHGDPESAMISLVQGTGANVMPPKGQIPYYVPFVNPFISWFNSGAPNN